MLAVSELWQAWCDIDKLHQMMRSSDKAGLYYETALRKSLELAFAVWYYTFASIRNIEKDKIFVGGRYMANDILTTEKPPKVLFLLPLLNF